MKDTIPAGRYFLLAFELADLGPGIDMCGIDAGERDVLEQHWRAHRRGYDAGLGTVDMDAVSMADGDV